MPWGDSPPAAQCVSETAGAIWGVFGDDGIRKEGHTLDHRHLAPDQDDGTKDQQRGRSTRVNVGNRPGCPPSLVRDSSPSHH